jgi:hypothetical protein
VLDRAHHRLLAARQAGFAPAEDALVGLDLDDQLVANADPDREGLDRGDLHRQAPASQSVADSQTPGAKKARAILSIVTAIPALAVERVTPAPAPAPSRSKRWSFCWSNSILTV